MVEEGHRVLTVERIELGTGRRRVESRDRGHRGRGGARGLGKGAARGMGRRVGDRTLSLLVQTKDGSHRRG